MSDLIRRQAAIDAFMTELTKRECKNLLHTWSTVEVKYFITDMLEQLPSADVPTKCIANIQFDEEKLKEIVERLVPQWIPCSERLPELEKDVLATLFHANGELGIVMVKRTTSFNPRDTYWEDWANVCSWENENVLAWMPLPEPYKGEQK